MDPSLDDSLTLEGMDFDHSEDVVNQEDITLEDTGRLDTISMDMDDIGHQSHNLMEAANDEVIVSDLIEEPFPFQEYTIQCGSQNRSNIMISPNQINELNTPIITTTSPNLQTLLKAPAAPMSNVVTLKSQPRVTKRLVSTAPPRQVAIAPKPVQPKTIHYAIAPKPVVVSNKHGVPTVKKIPITTDGKGNTVLAQIGRQLVMVPKKIKLMSSSASSSAEGLLSTSSAGVQYQMAMTQDQMQMLNTNKTKPMLKFIQLPAGQSSAESSSSSGALSKIAPANAPRARYVMQQKTVPISIGGKTVKIAGKKQIIAIKSSQSPQVAQTSTSQGITTKKVVISSNANQKLLLKPATSSAQAIKDSSTTGQRTQFHPINVPGKGIQYIKLVTNQPPQKVVPKVAANSKNFVFTDSKGNVIQMTAEKVSQSPSVLIPGTSSKGVVKTIKGQNKLVRIAPISKAVTQSTSQPARSSQSLLAPITATVPAMTSSPIETPAETAAGASLDFCQIDEDKLSNYIVKSDFESNDFSIANETDYSVEGYSTANEFDDASNLHEETVEDPDPEDKIEVKPTLQSLISEAVGDDTGEEMHSMQEVEIEYENKRDVFVKNASFLLHDNSNLEHDTSNGSGMNEESVIIVPGNYVDRQNESLYSDDSQTYRRYSEENKRNVPMLAVSVEAECLPYQEHAMPQSPHMSDQEAAATLDMRPRKACNCTKSQCLKLYCDCFANGEFCNSCNCNNCHNNLDNEEVRQKAIRSCLERNPNAFRPKIGKSKAGGPEIIRRHTKGCNCKRSGCLKNYCECYEAKIACTAMCKCVGCRNVEETLVRRRDAVRLRDQLGHAPARPAPPPPRPAKQACSFMTCEVIEAVCQCLLAAAAGGGEARADPVHDVIEEFARCLQDVITASHHAL